MEHVTPSNYVLQNPVLGIKSTYNRVLLRERYIDTAKKRI